MRLPRLRFTVRWMMIGVGLVALASCLGERSSRFRGLADHHRSEIADVSRGARSDGLGEILLFDNREPFSIARYHWHETLAEKYRRAASRPWLPISPDPPEPE